MTRVKPGAYYSDLCDLLKAKPEFCRFENDIYFSLDPIIKFLKVQASDIEIIELKKKSYITLKTTLTLTAQSAEPQALDLFTALTLVTKFINAECQSEICTQVRAELELTKTATTHNQQLYTKQQEELNQLKIAYELLSADYTDLKIKYDNLLLDHNELKKEVSDESDEEPKKTAVKKQAKPVVKKTEKKEPKTDKVDVYYVLRSAEPASGDLYRWMLTDKLPVLPTTKKKSKYIDFKDYSEDFRLTGTQAQTDYVWFTDVNLDTRDEKIIQRILLLIEFMTEDHALQIIDWFH